MKLLLFLLVHYLITSIYGRWEFQYEVDIEKIERNAFITSPQSVGGFSGSILSKTILLTEEQVGKMDNFENVILIITYFDDESSEHTLAKDPKKIRNTQLILLFLHEHFKEGHHEEIFPIQRSDLVEKEAEVNEEFSYWNVLSRAFGFKGSSILQIEFAGNNTKLLRGTGHPTKKLKPGASLAQNGKLIGVFLRYYQFRDLQHFLFQRVYNTMINKALTKIPRKNNDWDRTDSNTD